MTEVANIVCQSCGAQLTGKFCEQCGEQRITTHDYSIVHFFEHALETFTHFDYRSLRALKVLFTQPGELTRAYLRGKRKAFVGPIQMFVIVNVVYAFIGGTTFKTPLKTQEHDKPFPEMKSAMVARAIEHGNLTREEFAKAFDSNAGAQGKTWIFAMIPALAFWLAVVYGFRRYYFEHLVFATHFYAFMLLFILAASVVIQLALLVVGIRPGAQRLDYAISLAALGGLVLYLYMALRRTYGGGKVATAIRAVAVGAAIYPILIGYRFLLFFVTLNTIH